MASLHDNLRQSISDNNCHRTDNLRHTREEIAALIPRALLAVSSRNIAAVTLGDAFFLRVVDVYINDAHCRTLAGADYSAWLDIAAKVTDEAPTIPAPKRRAIAACIYLELV
jgi:hypothetical protein